MIFLAQVLTIAAMLSVSSPYFTRSNPNAEPFEWVVKQGDHLSLLNLYNMYQRKQRDRNWVNDNRVNPLALKRAAQIRQQLTAYLKRAKLSVMSTNRTPNNICKAIATGYFCNAARLQSDGITV